jgi:hypothetical protein
MINRDNISDWLNRADYTAEERRNICAQIMSEAQYWDSTQYQRMMHDSTKRPWVGLTAEEIQAFDTWHDNREEEVGWVNPSEIVAYIDAKLKEKNGYAEGKNT